ncbi:MAG: OmpA family protein [Candidatus Marinimicrobia bacterium]|jgi:outer membrane protein OmpA-like peptidoglycan-associated protein|nr:OmpA family protein [Candidatus Neomarinimicrobiota bacterium]MDP7059807.1 OmpA family protein [Candidatus Neomarinimicrobiota bacterium]|tara:strand:- start:7893 stop:9518 length:1626 start_codon:yes stop_codon:yes gene_type:complete
MDLKYLRILITVLTPVLVFSQDSLSVINADTTQKAIIFIENLENDSTVTNIPENIMAPPDSAENIQLPVVDQANNVALESDSVELLNICKSIVYVLNNENLSFSEAKDFAEAVTERLKEKVKNIRIVNTYYDTECQSPDCALDDVKNTDASHVFILSTEIDRLTTESVITFRNISYDRDSDEFQSDSEKDLNLLLDLLKEYPEMTIEVQSHTDREGDADYNKDLSQRRAAKMKEWLEQNNVESYRMLATGWGEAIPAVVSKRESARYPYLRERFPLTEMFIGSLINDDQRAVADSLNRRTEVRIIDFPQKNQLKGILDIGLYSIDHDSVASDSGLSSPYIFGNFSHFFGVEKNIFPRTQEIVDEFIDILNIESCESANNTPVASDQLVPAGSDSVLYIMLSASDPDQDSLTYYISNFPSHGTLYQFKDDSIRGDEITDPSYQVLSPEHKIIYVPDSDSSFTDTLSFYVDDGQNFSESANIFIGEFSFFELLLDRSPFLDFVASTPPVWISAGLISLYLIYEVLNPEPPPKKPVPPNFPYPG